jgi:2-amino-4-hydroxy-6-hydroxymethyldihydropteridine diphosphokinase
VRNSAFIGLGANVGNRYENMMSAIKLITSCLETKLVNYSSVYETDPVGNVEQNLFLNMVIEVQTALSALQLLELCMKIELELGRKREEKWGPRTIDLDILTFNQENIKTEKLIVPHPRMFERAFVMVPLLEINNEIRFSEELPKKEGVRIWKRKNGDDVFEPIES